MTISRIKSQRIDPAYDIAWLDPDFESKPQAFAHLENRVAVLWRGTVLHVIAGGVLARCLGGNPCGTVACPLCMRRFRRQFVSDALQRFAGDEDLQFVTLVPQEGVVPAGSLDGFPIDRMLNTTKQRIRRAQIPGLHAVGYVDFTFDETAGVWRVHQHLIVAGTTRDALQSALGRFYERYPGVYRPMVIKAVYDRPRAFSYVAKSFWLRKVAYSTPEGEKRARAFPLKPIQERELLTYLVQQRTTDLSLLVGQRANRR